MTVLKSKNIAVEIAEILSDRIIRMEYRPGDRILEAKIAKELDVSQSSIRESLRILEQSGLVEINQRRGTYVTRLKKSDVEILYDMLGELYAILIRRAMEKKDDPNVEKVLKVLEKIIMAGERNDVETYYNAIFEFAIVAIDLVNSSLLKKMILDLWPTKRRIEYVTLSARKKELKNNMKYFQQMGVYLLESKTEKIVKTIQEYSRNEKETALRFLPDLGIIA